MKSLEINSVEFSEETLVSYKGYKFSVKTIQQGSYGFQRLVTIRVVKEDLESFMLQKVGHTRFHSDDVGNLPKGESEGCLIFGKPTYNECLDKAKEFITKYVDFIKE